MEVANEECGIEIGMLLFLQERLLKKDCDLVGAQYGVRYVVRYGVRYGVRGVPLK